MTRSPRPLVKQHFLVPNNWYGRAILWIIKRYLNRRCYQLTLRGRTPRIPIHGRRYNVPRANALYLGVYLTIKRSAEREHKQYTARQQRILDARLSLDALDRSMRGDR